MITETEFSKLKGGDLVKLSDGRMHTLHPLWYPEREATGFVCDKDYDSESVLVQWPYTSSCKGAKIWITRKKLYKIETYT